MLCAATALLLAFQVAASAAAAPSRLWPRALAGAAALADSPRGLAGAAAPAVAAPALAHLWPAPVPLGNNATIVCTAQSPTAIFVTYAYLAGSDASIWTRAVVAASKADGHALWTFTSPVPTANVEQDGSDFCALTSGALFVTLLDPQSLPTGLYAFNTASGAIAWRRADVEVDSSGLPTSFGAGSFGPNRPALPAISTAAPFGDALLFLTANQRDSLTFTALSTNACVWSNCSFTLPNLVDGVTGPFTVQLLPGAGGLLQGHTNTTHTRIVLWSVWQAADPFIVWDSGLVDGFLYVGNAGGGVVSETALTFWTAQPAINSGRLRSLSLATGAVLLDREIPSPQLTSAALWMPTAAGAAFMSSSSPAGSVFLGEVYALDAMTGDATLLLGNPAAGFNFPLLAVAPNSQTIYVGTTCFDDKSVTYTCLGVTLSVLSDAKAGPRNVALPTLAAALPIATSPADGTALVVGAGSAESSIFTLLGVTASGGVAWARASTLPSFQDIGGFFGVFDSAAAGVVYVADGDPAAPASAAVFLWAEGLPAPPRAALNVAAIAGGVAGGVALIGAAAFACRRRAARGGGGGGGYDDGGGFGGYGDAPSTRTPLIAPERALPVLPPAPAARGPSFMVDPSARPAAVPRFTSARSQLPMGEDVTLP